jgi:hypothetical protein
MLLRCGRPPARGGGMFSLQGHRGEESNERWQGCLMNKPARCGRNDGRANDDMRMPINGVDDEK